MMILSGRSGSGKTVALRALEDLGFNCIDNLPVSLLPVLAEKISAEHGTVVVSIDARAMAEELSRFDDIIDAIERSGLPCEILFFDAADDTLLKRFSETRRRHPLTHDGLSLLEAIRSERLLLEPISNRADLLIDTTLLGPYKLRDLIRDRIINRTSASMALLFESFGYKHGVPSDADFVFDARCLPNPYWDVTLRPLTGRDQPIIDFLQQDALVLEFFWQIKVFLHTWVPRFEQDNRAYMTVAIGCTGGQHRSVYLVEQLAEHFRKERENVQIRHRELS